MRQIHLFAVVLANQFERILEHRHHAQPEQIDFDDAHVRAVVFVPLHDHAARHGGRFQRNHRIELALADHHAAGMLPQMPRQVLHRQIQLEKLAHTRIAQVEAGIAELLFRRVVRILPFPRAERGSTDVRAMAASSKPSAFADLARRRPAAIGDDVCGHGRAESAIALVDVLNRALALDRRSANRYRYPATRRALRKGIARTAIPSPTGSTAVIPSA